MWASLPKDSSWNRRRSKISVRAVRSNSASSRESAPTKTPRKSFPGLKKLHRELGTSQDVSLAALEDHLQPEPPCGCGQCCSSEYLHIHFDYCRPFGVYRRYCGGLIRPSPAVFPKRHARLGR